MPSPHSNAAARKSGPTVGLVPFTGAAHEHVEPAFDVSNTIGANVVTLGPFDVPAYGFLRHIFILVNCTGGVAGTATADAPWNILSEVTLLDVNGAPIFGPYTGYQTMLANVFGGFAFRQDPRLAPDAQFATSPNYVFGLRIPVEIHHNNGLGALANQNAAAAYKVRLGMNASTNVWSVAPTTLPVVRIRGYLEAWSMPADHDLLGRPQETEPPNHGTTQYWTVFQKALVAGTNSIILPRVGNLVRNLILVARDGSGVRQANVMTDPAFINWDARQLINEPLYLRRLYMSERNITFDFPTGVYAYQLDADVLGHAGDGSPELWLPTVQATRLEIAGSAWLAGTLEVLTNDVAPVEANQAARFDERSATGFEPAFGAPMGSR